VLAKADRDRGTFRSLLCTVTIRVIQDWRRRHPELPSTNDEPVAPAPDFDRAWAVHLTERALGALKEVSPRAYEVVLGHLAGVKQDRNKLWIARRKLVALIRREVAVLSPYLRPSSRAALFSVQKS
jgi:hypothetical protein